MRRRKRIELSFGDYLSLIGNTKSDSYFNADLSQPDDFGTVSTQKSDDYRLSKTTGLPNDFLQIKEPVDAAGEEELLQLAAEYIGLLNKEK